MKKNIDSKNIHGGHRKRLLSLAIEAGLDSMSEIQVLEFILTIIIPRVDTNPLAHALLNEFGSVHAVLEANPYSLMSVKGVGERTARLLTMFPAIFAYYKKNSLPRNFIMDKFEKCALFIQTLLEHKTVEELYIVALNVKFRVIQYKLISRGSIKGIGINTQVISQFISNTKAAHILLGHNHPKGNADPSENDIKATRIIEDLARLLGVKFIDHLIVGQDGIYSIKHKELIPLK